MIVVVVVGQKILVVVVVLVVISDVARLESYTSFVVWETEIIIVIHWVKRDWIRRRRTKTHSCCCAGARP